ncbi:putative ABC transport system ATP-binding protein [Jeotgalicoccus aerolatus]|uniref:Putative hemin import ATP-binding protein HrtA n=1 Tax=Jeotgalicoccus aerolatus TaxID=709510 RepID=A0A1G8XI29_9STAP|nr:ABC transporter ATP-binding protein [Jeotgalicoccus aerolatus]SDJ89555.1 putative ABC transport system ATP-binding protein [Jeotgalicoccus aerolatus]
MSVFQLEDIKKEFKHGNTSEQILKDIDLKLNKGQLTALVGASGSGKSTLLTIAAGLQKLTDGTISFGGQNLSSMNDEQVREVRAKHFGFVFQHAHLVPFLTVQEQLELMIDTAELKWSKKDKQSRIEDVLKTVDMWNHKDSFPENLSGGEKQRVAIARAIIHEPEILFADEPTASLDSKRSVEVIELIERLASELNITVLMVTHDNDMLKYAERIVEMKDGKII